MSDPDLYRRIERLEKIIQTLLSAEGHDLANVALLNAANIFTAAQTVQLDAAAAAALGLDNNIILTNSDGGVSTPVGISIGAAGAQGGTRAILFFVRSRGTIDSPTAAANGDLIATLTGAGYDGSTTQATAYIEFLIDGAVSSGVVPQAISFFTGATNTASRTRRLKILPGGGLETYEITAPSAPAANAVRIYAEDNGAGKTRLMALFSSGAAQQIAIQP